MLSAIMYNIKCRTYGGLIMIEEKFVIKSRTENHYIICNVLTEETIEVDARVAEEIYSYTGESQDNVAVLLAQIETIRKSTYRKEIENTKVKKDILISAIKQLLKVYPAETLVDYFEDMKYFEIKEILNSDYPVQEIRRKI